MMPAEVKHILNGATVAAILPDNCTGKEVAQKAGKRESDEQKIDQAQRKRQNCCQNQSIAENSRQKGTEGASHTKCQGQAQGRTKICAGRKNSVQISGSQKCYQEHRGTKHEGEEQQRVLPSVTQIEPSAVT